MGNRELLLHANPEYLAEIADSFQRTQEEQWNAAQSVSGYWEHHRSQAGFEILNPEKGLVRIHGRSGFYFPGRSYSTLEWINTLDRLIWLALSPRQSRMSPIARRALGFSLPPAQKGFSQFGYPILGRRSAYDYLRAQYHLASLAPYLPRAIQENSERLLAIEIGPGTGLLALVTKQLFPNSTLVLVDLPEILPFSSIFLTTIMPGARFLFLDKFRVEHDRWMEYDFVLIPPAATRQLPTQSFHLALNTDSMQEMELATIREYFLLLRRLLRPPALFYSSNRVEKWTGNTNTRLADYPYQEADRELFSRENAFMHHRWIWKKYHYRIPYPWREPRRNGEIVIQKLTILTTNRDTFSQGDR